ncbi:MAG TPA: UDP-3-O-(3-hydroxymyristoyl)glucosamine N-acyltransferase [Oligoflexia bacterium]|nr:UDP-3-O-(3-hydroxymyristoyl)glucosamine N-acyltransferase [Oligoflexia bacterium]HMP49271.1 UDP-3-O-(3-hydroxymyristoyl)glucosamine N-acyltransferase [Oligoflexia bacterium]
MGHFTKSTSVSAREIADRLRSSVIGNDQININGISALEDIEPFKMSFYRGNSTLTLVQALKNVRGSLILISESLSIDPSEDYSPFCNNSFIKLKEPFHGFVSLVNLFYENEKPEFGIHPLAVIDQNAEVHPSSEIGPFSYIGPGAKIDSNVIIHPHVTIYPGVHIGSGCIIHSGSSIREDVILEPGVVIQNGAIIGADGFGYLPDPIKGLIPVPQIGNVILSTGAEIGANTCIDRATLGSTRIGKGTKIDNLVQIGHNTQIGSHTIVCGQSAIAGSAKIGNQVVLGGNVGVADHTEIADGCRFGAFSGLHGKYLEKGDYAGNPALPARTYRRVVACMPKIPEVARKVLTRKQSEDS